jgi:hypothetical protein
LRGAPVSVFCAVAAVPAVRSLAVFRFRWSTQDHPGEEGGEEDELGGDADGEPAGVKEDAAGRYGV